MRTLEYTGLISEYMCTDLNERVALVRERANTMRDRAYTIRDKETIGGGRTRVSSTTPVYRGVCRAMDTVLIVNVLKCFAVYFVLISKLFHALHIFVTTIISYVLCYRPSFKSAATRHENRHQRRFLRSIRREYSTGR